MYSVESKKWSFGALLSTARAEALGKPLIVSRKAEDELLGLSMTILSNIASSGSGFTC